MASDSSKSKDGAEIVKPPRDLRSKVRVMSDREAARFDPVKSAEAALERLSNDFDGWMASEADTLATAWTEIRDQGLTEERCATLFRAAHDIKGQASTFGYPLVGSVAGNLCHLIEHVPREDLPLKLVEQHVDAVRAMVAETAQQEDNATARALVDRLVDVTEDFIARTAPGDPQAPDA
ncbi:Hpt domain-containing protein [Stappia sp.]|uniref:Hpt domain-containing protein n=1 Tax=Stappia sp. TaxID=1870903 RepID=UPI0032D953AA